MFTEILDSMPSLTNRSTWSEAQQMLLDNSLFTEDVELQSELNHNSYDVLVLPYFWAVRIVGSHLVPQ